MSTVATFMRVTAWFGVRTSFGSYALRQVCMPHTMCFMMLKHLCAGLSLVLPVVSLKPYQHCTSIPLIGKSH